MADLNNQTEEALGWAAEGKKLAVDIPEVSFKDAATFVAEMTPIVGDVMAAKEVYDELQKDEPNYYLAGALGGAAIVGLIPGLGDIAAKAIKKGAREVFDVSKRVEVDLNAMGSGLGNVTLKPKPITNTEATFTNLNLSDSDVEIMSDTYKKIQSNLSGSMSNNPKAIQEFDDRIQAEIDRRTPLIEASLKKGLDTDKPNINLQEYKNALMSTSNFDDISLAAGSIAETEQILNKMGPYMMDSMINDDAVVSMFESISKEAADNPRINRIYEDGEEGALLQWAMQENAIRKSYNKMFKTKAEPDPTRFTPMRDTNTADTFPPAENAARTQIAGTLPTYKKADALLTELSGEGKTLDFGAGLGLSKKELGFDTYEPFPKGDFTPDFNNPADIPSNAYKKVTNLNVLNVVPREVRDGIVKDIGRVLEPNGRAVITTRGRDVMDAKGTAGPEPMSIITSRDTYQKGFTQPELRSYITDTLGDGFAVINNKLGAAGVTVHKLPTQNFNEGGTVMNDQTEMAFGYAIGGLAEDVDPVSGNEVPVGSMPEEVRDDISAQLSEGEYVVPADVVRFFGVKLFEDLRMQAKMGFQQMEANGRIGGEPVEASGMEVVQPEDDMDIMFDDADFEVVDGYSGGGVASTNDAFGVLSSSLGQGAETMEMREYVNAAGDTISIMFFNGMPMSAIPQGYSEVAPAPDPATTGRAVTTANDVPSSTRNDNNDNNDNNDPVNTPDPINYKELTASELQTMVKDSKGLTQSVIGSGAVMLNPILGLAVKAAMWHQRKQVEKEITRRMKDETLGKSARGQYADLLEISLQDSPGMWTRLFGTEEEKEKSGLGDLPFDPVSAEPEAIDSAIKEAMEYTGEEPILGPEPIEVTSLNDIPGERDYEGGPYKPEVTKPESIKNVEESDAAFNAAAKEALSFANSERDKRRRAAETAAAKADSVFERSEVSGYRADRDESNAVSLGRGTQEQVQASRDRAAANRAAVSDASKMTGGVTKENVEKAGGTWAAGGRSKGGLMKKKKKK